LLSMTVLMTSVFLTDQAFAGFETCEQCDTQFDQCTLTPEQCIDQLNSCRAAIECPSDAIGGEFIGIETTSVLAAGAQYTAAWMIPVIVAAAGFGLIIQTQITRLKNNMCPNCKSETKDTFELGEKLVGKCKNSICRVSLFYLK